MELSDYLRIIRRRGWIIVLLALLTAGAAYGFSLTQPNVYKSTARLLVTSRPDFGQTQAARELRRDFAAYLQSSYVAQDVIDALQIDMDPFALLQDVTIAPATDSNIIVIEVESGNGDLANDIARAWGDALIQWRNEENAGLRREDRIGAQFIDDPRYGQESPRPPLNAAAGGVFGLLTGLILVFVLEWFASAVLRRADDVERLLELPVIGKIPR